MPHSVKAFRVLCIEDTTSDCSLVIRELERLYTKVYFKKISSLHDLKHHLKGNTWNLVVSNYRLPSFSAFDALTVVKDLSPELPFILLTESVGEEDVADLMKAGVEDVVVKSRLERLIPVVKRLIREHETKDKEAKAQRVASEAFAAKEQMLAIVSHDIKNPLSAIKLEAQMLLRAVEKNQKTPLGDEVKIQANRILKTTERMKILISDLLDKNKSENGLAAITKSKADPSRLLKDVLDSLRPLILEKEIMVTTSIPEGTIVCIDRNKMFQVFSNLITNAIKFTPRGGAIYVSLEENDHEFIFSIHDSGPGLKDKELNKVFEKYWTGSGTDCAGTGLGLFICKTIVEAHGGHIFVENTSEGGATFRFSVPKVATNLENASFSYYERKDVRKKIYIVDDDEDLREVLSWALGKEGYSIFSFQSPQEALDCLSRGNNRPDLIVVDFHMDEMKGSDFVFKKNEISSANGCPVVMISGSPYDVEREIPRELYEDIIPKPLDLEGLVDNVKRFIH